MARWVRLVGVLAAACAVAPTEPCPDGMALRRQDATWLCAASPAGVDLGEVSSGAIHVHDLVVQAVGGDVEIGRAMVRSDQQGATWFLAGDTPAWAMGWPFLDADGEVRDEPAAYTPEISEEGEGTRGRVLLAAGRPGRWTGRLDVANGGDGFSLTRALAAEAVVPCVQADPPTLDFGDLLPGRTACVTVSLTACDELPWSSPPSTKTRSSPCNRPSLA